MADGLPADEVVRSLFQSILSRPPDPEALAFYSRALGWGARVESIVRSLDTSPEAGVSEWRDPPARALGPPLWSARQAHPGERQIFVLDVPGCGGDGLVEALQAAAAGRVCLTGLRLDQAAWVPALLLHHASLVSGALGAGATRWLSRDVLTAVVIRHPVDRVAAHHASLTSDPVTARAMRGVSLATFVSDPVWRPLVADLQARYLTGPAGVPGEWDESSADAVLASRGRPGALYRDLPLQALIDLGGTQEPPDLLDRAADALARFDVVGTPKDVPAMLGRLAAAWGGAAGGTPPPARGRLDRSPAAVGPELADAILAANPVDLELYERARSLAP